MMRRTNFGLLFLLFASLSFGQTDSLQMLSFEDYMKQVREHHPMVRQAELAVEQGEASVLRARGAFDPKLYSDVYQKYFDGSQYYSHIQGGLKIPTWYGIELEANYSTNQGIFLNPELKTPAAGLWSAGLSITLGEGLFIDKRRAELRKAKLYRESTGLEQRLMMNELFYQAGKAYWDWFKAYHKLKVYEEAFQVAQQRLEIVRQEAAIGERPGIDTVEAGIQMQNRLLRLQEAELAYDNQSELLSVFLWAEGLIPLELDTISTPLAKEDLDPMELDEDVQIALDNIPANHPKLQQFQLKMQQLEVERQMKIEQLKPNLNIGYKPLAAAGNPDLFSQYTINDYMWELGFETPLFLRKERGELKMANIQIENTELELSNQQQMISFKVRSALNTWRTTIQQIRLYERTVRDYARLLEAERRLFQVGESSLFMVNSRESNFISAQIQLIELMTQNRKAGLDTRYALGDLNP